MALGLSVVMIYTLFGGMFSVAIMDFIQMIAIFLGLLVVAYIISGKFEGGVMEVVQQASANNKFDFWPELDWVSILAFIGAFVTLALGSIPQQDVFQRVLYAKNEKSPVRGTVIDIGREHV